MNVFRLISIFKTKFWKKELVGRGVERRLGEKKGEGSGTTLESVSGKRNGKVGCLLGGGVVMVSGGSGNGENDDSGGDRGGEGGLHGLRGFLNGLVTSLVTLLPNFFSTIRMLGKVNNI
ncbi:hypothetical protein Nepgr_006129 [Nepenthes gracilis]|uniref:Uncharacterized protein n=1 Tax=Nepenthes gracilis TaxID=150966 RepID=A0AAD3XH41_NEPGR|nr:hypothetical protein Nepgr_006129 [Nepenthes gracilis]